MAYSSPYGTPGEEYLYARERFQSATPTPSPRGHAPYYYSTPVRPSTRAHFRNGSGGFDEYNSRPPTTSPRYTSDGHYATANVSSGHHSRKNSWATPSHPPRERRPSYVYYQRDSPVVVESDEDEIIEVHGRVYVVQGGRARDKGRSVKETYFYEEAGRGYATDHHYATQGGFTYYERDPPAYEPPRRVPAHNTHTRQPSGSIPQRQPARPPSSHKKPPKPPPKPRPATEADAKEHAIPPGYSLKNWDPSEAPILLLGSVFDSNSLGKWIYDWTVFHHGAGTPISEMAGELWLLLIQLAGKIKRAEQLVGEVRAKKNQEMIDDFIASGERLNDRLFALLKACEAPMLRANKKGSASLGKNSGVQFVETLFGRERQLEKTEQFMQAVRVFNLRFDVNCEPILCEPTE